MHTAPSPERSPIGLRECAEALERRRSGAPVWRYFDRRLRGHREATRIEGSKPLPPPLGGARLREELAAPSSRRRVIYVHVPFCSRFCSFCSFCAFLRRPAVESEIAAYVRALSREIDRSASSVWVRKGPPFEAVYFGGGTPTSLHARDLAELVTRLRGAFPTCFDAEITVESRFDGVDAAYLRTLRGAGVNRLSFGVQSFDTEVRRGVGRVADREGILSLLEEAARIGFTNVSLDLIYNLPGQTKEIWAADMATLRTCPATASSTYALIPMPGSPLVQGIEAGREPPLGDLEHEYGLFETSLESLERRSGWRRFGFQHFGRIGVETSVYNGVRAGGLDTLGLGCGAGGRIGALSYANARDPSEYCADQETLVPEHAMAFEADPRVLRLAEAWQLVEGDGIARARLLEVLPGFSVVLGALEGLDLVRTECGRSKLTRDGCFWAYDVLSMLTDEMNRSCATSAGTSPLETHAKEGALACRV